MMRSPKAGHGPRLGRGDKSRADPHAVRAERKGGRKASSVKDASCGDDGNRAVDRIDDERHEGEGGDCTRMATRFGSLCHDHVASRFERATRVFNLAAHRDDEHPMAVTEFDHVPRHAESRDERAGPALDEELHVCAERVGKRRRAGRHRRAWR